MNEKGNSNRLEDLPTWKRGPSSIFRDSAGAYSSKRVAGFLSIGAAIYATYIGVDVTVIGIWLAFAAGLWGFSLGESAKIDISSERKNNGQQ